MEHLENSFQRLKKTPPLLTVKDNFEDQVFIKIKRKKVQHKIVTMTSLAVVITVSLFLFQMVVFHEPASREIMAGNDFQSVETLTPSANSSEGKNNTEAIPLVEDVVFASYDSQTNYSVEQVAYYEDEDTL